MRDLFSDIGIAAWLERLEDSADYREAAAGWTGTVVLVEEATAPARATWLQVVGGTVSARPATDQDREQAEFVLAASADTWHKLVSGQVPLISAAMNGDLKLVRGNLFRLIPHAKAAAALLAAAS